MAAQVTRTVVLDDAERTVTALTIVDGAQTWKATEVVYKASSPGDNEAKVRGKLRGALDRWATLTVNEKDEVLEGLVRLLLGEFTSIARAPFTFKFTNDLPVTQSGHPSATIPAGTVVFEIDALGNLVLGKNPLLNNRTGNLLANGRVPTGMMYQQESHFLFVGGGIAICPVGDPGDLIFARYGPDNTWPDNGGLGVAGIPAGSSIGMISWRSAATPSGGTPDVTLGGELQSASVTLYARATEHSRKVGNAYQQGGELIAQSTPNGTSTAVDRGFIRNDGKAQAAKDLQVDGALKLTNRPVLATGAAHTVDDVIATMQTLGLCRQS